MTELCGDIDIQVKDSQFGVHEGRYECQRPAGHPGGHQGILTATRHVDNWTPVHRDDVFTTWGTE